MSAVLADTPPPLPGLYGTPPAASALRPSQAVVHLVRSQIQALLMSTPVYHALDSAAQRSLEQNLVKIASYAAECVRDDWYQSLKLGQRPMVRVRETMRVRTPAQPGTPLASAQAAGDFQPAAANQVARVTRETLNAIAFPTFVAELIRGTFNAITQSNIQQMEAYLHLIANVSQTVDEFMNQNISDNQARDWLAQQYPDHVQVHVQDGAARAAARPGSDERPQPNFMGDLGLPGEVSADDDSIEEVLVPAARRKLAQTRLQILSMMVLMGINRIVVTGGKIRAAMNFHIDTRDMARQQHASDLDLRVAAAGSFGFGPWSASLSTSVAYVNSDRAESTSEINTDTNLSSEVEIHFKSDYFPVERFAGAGAIGRIQGNTPVPEANTPERVPWGGSDDNRPAQARRASDSAPAMPAMPAMPGMGSAPRPPDRPTTPERQQQPAGAGVSPAAPKAGAGVSPAAPGAAAQPAPKTGAGASPAAPGAAAQPAPGAAAPVPPIPAGGAGASAASPGAPAASGTPSRSAGPTNTRPAPPQGDTTRSPSAPPGGPTNTQPAPPEGDTARSPSAPQP